MGRQFLAGVDGDRPGYNFDITEISGFAGAQERVYRRVFAETTGVRWPNCLNDTRKIL